ncbi:MAG TPA: molybdopterin cofactor-binding domain-containing protein [Bryobacteraceae bacterium]|nr:molybdopterin cofactor-binding domain-containing protein [Bryobacteraceae bacterium]
MNLEPERYEFLEPPLYRFELDRRDFFKALGLGVLIVVTRPADAQRRDMPDEIGAWLHIGEDGVVSVYTGKAEMGQNIRTSLAQGVSEELRVPLESIRMIMADTDLVPYDAGTFGSRSTPYMAPQLRKAAVAARELLLQRAAEQWKVDPASVTVAAGKVSHAASKRSATYAELAHGQKLMKAISGESAAPPTGASAPKVNGRDFVTGRHKYTSDLRLPGMLYGKVLRPPAFGAKLASVDKQSAEAIAGATVVHDGDFAGVAAPDELTAERALSALRAQWKQSPAEGSNATLYDDLRRTAENSESVHSAGSVEQGTAAAAHRLKQTYRVAYIAHCPLEPRAALAQWTGGKLTVWTGSQRPFGVRSELAKAFQLDEKQVRVIIPDTGSGYGGKHSGEAAIEAARLARAAGKPVKLLWTREEEFTWAYFRPAGVIDVSAAISKDGTLSAWEFHNYNSGASGIRTLYNIPNQKIEFHRSESPLRQGSYRALAATANHFARESAMDEAAHLAGMDPLEFRRRNLEDARLLAVLNTVAEEFGWPGAKPAGIACGFEKGGYVASCAEVDVDRSSGKVKVTRIVTAFECGAVVNPEHLRNQIEGAVIMGIGGALFEAIEFENGTIRNAGFSGYRVPRFADTPVLGTVLVDRKDLPSAGAGETPIVCVAPAIGNAIFRASGVRLRSLPLLPKGVLPHT